MPTRKQFIEQIRRQIYGGVPTDDAEITDGLVNQYLNQGVGIAAQKNYRDNFQLEGIGFINNSFYSTFKGLVITADETNLYKFTLPQIPVGIGDTDGISRIVFKDSKNLVSYPAIILNENQVAIQRQMRPIPNKISCYPEGIYCYAITPILMNNYTATVTMVSGGVSSDLDSNLNVPDDYIPAIIEFMKAQLSFERMQLVDAANDGQDAVKTI